MEVQGFIPRERVKLLLENYQALAAGDLVLDAIPCNSGPKAYDGVTSSRLNKIMLDEAIEGLPILLRACAVLRWVKCRPRREAIASIGVSQDQYYKYCDAAVDAVYHKINGKSINYQNFYEKIKNNT